MTASDVDRRIEKIAGRQHGAFSRMQAARAGATADVIEGRVRRGAWVRLDSAVYALTAFPPTYLRQCWAAALGMPGAAIGGECAAALLGLTGYRRGAIELVVARGENARSKLAVVHRVHDARLTKVDGLPISTIAQTLFDVAARSSIFKLERAMDDAIAARRLSVPDLEERLGCYEGWRRAGVPKMRALIEERSAEAWVPPESELERVLLKVLARLPGRPDVLRQHPFPWRDAAPGRVDAWIPAYRALVEGDGRRWHTRVADFDRDRWRDNLAVVNGVHPLRFTWAHLTAHPADVLALVARLRP